MTLPSRPTLVAIVVGLLIAAAVCGVVIYDKGEKASSVAVKAAVATETVRTLDAARISKDR